MALKFLFCQEFAAPEESVLSVREKLTKFQNSFKAQAEVWKFTFKLLEALDQNKVVIDEQIKKNLVGWSLDRLSITDRNILRLAITEMFHLETPPKAAINEAVDLTKKYSTKESSAFVNGLLDSLLSSENLS
jgi:N utilization substance protein B